MRTYAQLCALMRTYAHPYAHFGLLSHFLDLKFDFYFLILRLKLDIVNLILDKPNRVINLSFSSY